MLKINFFPEQQIINRIKSNDRVVLGELYNQHRKMIFSYVLKNGGRNADAEDMLQEAIIVLWQNVCSGKFKLKSKISTYMLAIVKNKWRAESRKHCKLSDEPLPENRSDGRENSLTDLIRNENNQAVGNALNQISAGCKELLLLFYFEARSTKDIARIMSFSGPDVVKAKKYQCKKSLETAMKGMLQKSERNPK